MYLACHLKHINSCHLHHGLPKELTGETTEPQEALIQESSKACDCDTCEVSNPVFGVVLVEALAMGCPVIATRCGGPEDIVAEGDGFLVPTGDRDALSVAMGAMVARPDFDPGDLRQQCAARFGAVAIGQRWVAAYSEAMAGI